MRKNPDKAKRIRHRLDDKLTKLRDKIARRNQLVEQSARRKPEAGLLLLQAWAKRHKMAGLIRLCLDGRRILETFNAQAELESLELAGCYVIVSDVSKE